MQFNQKLSYIVLVSVSVVVGLLGMASIGLATGDTWTRKADMPTPRAGLSTSVVDGKIYAFGGADPVARHAIPPVEVYDPATDTWKKKADMPTARYSPSTAVVNGRIYVIGGHIAAWEPSLSPVEEYDPVTETWTKKADMPTPRAFLPRNAPVADGKIYVIGGASTREGPILPTVEAYDPATDTWTKKADMPTARMSLGTSAVNGKIYAIGGWIAEGVGCSTVEEYDPATDTWTRKADMSTARWGLSTSVVNGKIYAIGGNDQWTVVFSLVEEYDPATDTWTRKADMPTARHTFSTSVVNGKIYAIGGAPLDWNTPLATVEEYDPGLVPTSVEVTSWGQIKSLFKRLFK